MACTTKRTPLWRGAPASSVPKDIAAGAHVYPGCFASYNASGYLVNGADTASTRLAGIADGGGSATSNGEFQVDVIPEGIIKMKNSPTNPLNQSHVGKHCYIEDNETVASTSVNKVRAGLVEEVEADGVWVKVRAEAYREAVDLETGGDDVLDMTGILPGHHASTHAPGAADPVTNVGYTAAGAVGTVWGTVAPDDTKDAIDRIASEVGFLPGGPIPVTARRASIYVTAVTGLDTNPGTLAAPLLTMDRAMQMVPPDGYCNIYVSGNPAWAGGGQVPYAGYRGHLQILAVDALTAVGAVDAIAAYGSATGAWGRDQVTPTALVPADATDRSRFLLLEDDAADINIVRILEVTGGVWQTEPAGLTITPGNDVTLVTLTQTLAPVAAIAASPLHHEGDVKLIGFNVTSPGINGLTGLGFAACVIDGTAHVTSINMGYNASLGGITVDADLGAMAPGIHCPIAALTGSALADLVHGDYLPGCHVTMAGGASFLRLLSASAPGAGRVMGTVFEAGDFYVGNPEASAVFDQSRGVLAASGLQIMDGAKVVAGNSQFGDIVQAEDTLLILADDIGATSINSDGHLKAAGTGGGASIAVTDAAKAAGSDTYPFVFGQHSRRQGITFTGNLWPAATNLPAVLLDGSDDDSVCTLPAGPGVDRGTVALVQVQGGRHVFGACTGDNANAGGYGLNLQGFHSSFSAANGFALTGNAGGTTTVGIGVKGYVALPGAGVHENDFAAAGALSALEHMCVFEQRA